MRAAAWLLIALACTACEGPADPDAGSATGDAGARDADVRIDAGRIDDAGERDASLASDASVPLVTTVVIRYAGRPGVITLRGSGAPLRWDADTTTTTGPEAGTMVWETSELREPIELKPLLDGTWARGANYHVAPGERVEIAPRFVPGAGRVTVLDAAFRSSVVGGERPLFAYLPPSYDENSAARYPVVYMHDGQNLFDPAQAAFGVEWRVDETMNAAAEAGRCPDTRSCQRDDECGGARCESFREAIVIGVGNTSARIDEYTPSADPSYGGGRGDLYLRMLREELLPRVEATYRAHTGPAHTALVGSSLGGLISAYGGIVHPGTFGLIGAMSPSTWWDEGMILGEVATIPSRPMRALRVYVDSGDSGASSDDAVNTRELARRYEAVGYVEGDDLHYVLAPGHMHREADWARRLPGALELLLGPRERPLR